MSYPPWLKQQPEGITLYIKVKPASRQNEISINAAGGLVVSLQAVAEDGQANKMLIKFLAKLLRIQQKKIVIHRGVISCNKTILIAALPADQGRVIDIFVHDSCKLI